MSVGEGEGEGEVRGLDAADEGDGVAEAGTFKGR